MIRPAIGAGIEAGITSGVGAQDAPASDFYAPLTFGVEVARGSGTASYSRSTAASYFDSTQGLLVEVAANVPRFKTGGYFTEPAVTNLLSYSNDFADASWVKAGTNTGTSYKSEIGVDGTTSASSLADSDAGANATWYHVVNATLGDEYFYTVYVKKDTSATKFPGIMIQENTTEYAAICFDVRDGSYVVREDGATWNNPDTVSVESNGDYWRICMSFTALNTTTYRFYMFPTVCDTTPSKNWDVTVQGSNVLEKAQVEAGNQYCTSYFDNAGAAGARSADDLQYPVAGNLLVNDMSGYVEFTPLNDSDVSGNGGIWGSRTDGSNFTDLLMFSSHLYFRKKIAGTTYQASIAWPGGKANGGQRYKIGFRLSSTDGIDVWLDGVKGTNDSNTTNAILDTNFGVGGDDQDPPSPSNHTPMLIENLKLWKVALTDKQMKSLM
jgi:hypothetical protein